MAGQAKASSAEVCTCSGGGQAPGPPHIKAASSRCVWWYRNRGEGTDPTREVLALPVFGEDKSCRGHVRIDVDRLTAIPIRTEFCITIDTSSFLSSYEARAFAAELIEAADQADKIAKEASHVE